MLSSHCFARSPVPRSKRGVTRQPIPASCQWSFDISGQSLRTESPNTKVHFRFDFILRFNISSCAVHYGYGFQGVRQTSKEGWQDRGWGKTLFVVVRGREAPPGCCDGLFAQKATEGETCLIVTFARFELMMTAQERQETPCVGTHFEESPSPSSFYRLPFSPPYLTPGTGTSSFQAFASRISRSPGRCGRRGRGCSSCSSC